MLTVKDDNNFLIGHFSDFFAIIDYFLLTAYDPSNFNLELENKKITVNDQIYNIEYKAVTNNRGEENG